MVINKFRDIILYMTQNLDFLFQIELLKIFDFYVAIKRLYLNIEYYIWADCGKMRIVYTLNNDVIKIVFKQ